MANTSSRNQAYAALREQRLARTAQLERVLRLVAAQPLKFVLPHLIEKFPEVETFSRKTRFVDYLRHHPEAVEELDRLIVGSEAPSEK